MHPVHAAALAGYPLSQNDWSGQHLTGSPDAALAGYPLTQSDWSGEHLTGFALQGFPLSQNDWSGQHLTGSPAEYAAMNAFPEHYGAWCGGMHDYDHLVGVDMAALNGYPLGYGDWSGENLVGAGAGVHGGGGFHGGGHHGFSFHGHGGWGPWGWDGDAYPVLMPMPVPQMVDADYFDDGVY